MEEMKEIQKSIGMVTKFLKRSKRIAQVRQLALIVLAGVQLAFLAEAYYSEKYIILIIVAAIIHVFDRWWGARLVKLSETLLGESLFYFAKSVTLLRKHEDASGVYYPTVVKCHSELLTVAHRYRAEFDLDVFAED